MLSSFHLFLVQKPRCPPQIIRHQSESPLCDLRDLCAMLSSFRLFLAQKPRCSPQIIRRNPNPPP